MRNDKADPADGARNAYRTGRHQGCAGNGDIPNDVDIGTEAPGLCLAHGEDVEPPAHREQDDGGNQHRRQDAADLRQGHIRERTHRPIRDGSQFGLGVRNIFDESQDGAHRAADDDTGQNEHDVGVALHDGRNEHGECDRNDTADKSKAGKDEPGEAQQNGDGCADTSAAGNTEEVRRNKRVLEDTLVRHTGHGQHDTHQDRRSDAGQAESHDDVSGHLGVIAALVEQLSKQDVNAFLGRDRVLPGAQSHDH